MRKGERLTVAPGGSLAAIADSLGRVLLIDVHAVVVVRLWKVKFFRIYAFFLLQELNCQFLCLLCFRSTLVLFVPLPLNHSSILLVLCGCSYLYMNETVHILDEVEIQKGGKYSCRDTVMLIVFSWRRLWMAVLITQTRIKNTFFLRGGKTLGYA